MLNAKDSIPVQKEQTNAKPSAFMQLAKKGKGKKDAAPAKGGKC